MVKPTTPTPVNKDDSFTAMLKEWDDAEPVSGSFKESLAFFKERIDQLEEEPDEDSINAVLKYLGPNCSVNLLKKVKAVYEARLYEIEHITIPNLFSSENLTSMDFEDGSKVNIEISYESKTVDKVKAIDWLVRTGHGDAIRDSLDFLPGSFDDKALAFLKEGGYSFEIDKTVNGQTLKKIVKEQLNSGGELPPEDAIKFRAEKVAVFKYPKKAF